MAQMGGSAADGCRMIVLGGSKGGVGRSTLSKNLLVAAGQAGLKTIGIDFDGQRTLKKWADRREAAREKLSQIVPVKVIASTVEQWQQVVTHTAGYDVCIVDTAPGVEYAMAEVMALCRKASFVLVPTSPSTVDLESVIPWLRTLNDSGSRGTFILNRANRRTKSFGAARSALLRYGPLAPVEVPQLEDIMSGDASGLAVLDYDRAKGSDVMQDVWRFARMEIAL